jgi:asparagine synthase (glutamine-hydrolysing)
LVHRPDHPSAEQFWRDLPLLLWTQEEPFADASMAAHFSLMRLARQHGVPVLLSGQGADEVFGGYQSALFHYLGTRIRIGRLSEAMAAVGYCLGDGGARRANVLFHALPSRLARRLRRLRAHDLDWLAPEFRDVPSDLEPVESPDEDPSDSYMKCLLQVRTLPGFLHYEDRNSMAFGVETRLPFLDHRLVEAMLRVPARLRFEAGLTKARLRKIARPWVPPMILERRSKMGYPAPLGRWLRSQRALVYEQLADRRFRECPIFDWDVWKHRARAFLEGDDRQLHVFWRGYILGRWYSDCLVGDGTRPCE